MNHDPRRLRGLVTGGSSGIGLATAKMLARQGYDVVICGRRPDRLEKARDAIIASATEPVECETIVCDLAETEQTHRLISQVLHQDASLDLLVNNAAVAPLATLEQITPEIFETSINVNLKSVFYLTQHVWKQWIARVKLGDRLGQGSGLIVNISSMAAVDPFPGFSLYGASKAWLDLMTMALAAEGADFGIRVCSIRPGAVETPLLRDLFPDFPDDQCVSPDEIANVVWKCISDPVNYASGQAYHVTRQVETQD